jgi:kinetochore protein NDC80
MERHLSLGAPWSQPGRSWLIPIDSPTNAMISVRRSSVFPSARQSMAPGPNAFAPTAPTRETRPITNPAWRQTCRESIIDYLTLRNCPIQFTNKTLSPSPTQANFVTIFRFLVVELLEVEMLPGRKFEEEAMSVLKDLRYPLLETITKTTLGTAGNERNWVPLLPMISWLVELCKVSS